VAERKRIEEEPAELAGDTSQPHEPTTSAHEPASLLPPPINGAFCAPKIYARSGYE